MYRLLFVISVLLFSPQKSSAQDGQVSDAEWRFLLDFLEVSTNDLFLTLDTLSEEEWRQRISDESWSIAECVQHILLAEQVVFGQFKKALNTTPDTMLDLRQRDAWLLAKVTDRGVKVSTPLPQEKVERSAKELKNALLQSRASIRDFLTRQPDLPLRLRYGKSPYGAADAYQILLVITGHGMRHHQQILEILAEITS